MKYFLLSKTVSNHSYNDTAQVQKEWLHHIQSLKTDSSAKHNRKNNWDYNSNTSEMNDRNTQHAIKITDERVSKLFYKNSTESANQLNSQNLMKWKSYDLIIIFKYHKSLWLCDS